MKACSDDPTLRAALGCGQPDIARPRNRRGIKGNRSPFGRRRSGLYGLDHGGTACPRPLIEALNVCGGSDRREIPCEQSEAVFTQHSLPQRVQSRGTGASGLHRRVRGSKPGAIGLRLTATDRKTYSPFMFFSRDWNAAGDLAGQPGSGPGAGQGRTGAPPTSAASSRSGPRRRAARPNPSSNKRNIWRAS